VGEMLGHAVGAAETLHVVVYRNGDSEFGLVVDEIADIVTETIRDPFPSARQGLLGSAVIGGKVTDILDVEAVASWAAVSSTESLTRLTEALSGRCAESRLEEVRG